MLSIFPIVLSIYNFSVGAYIGVIGNVMQFISAIIAIVRLDIIKKEETEEQVEEKKVTE